MPILGNLHIEKFSRIFSAQTMIFSGTGVAQRRRRALERKQRPGRSVAGAYVYRYIIYILCIYVSMYLLIYVSMYVCMSVCMYVMVCNGMYVKVKVMYVCMYVCNGM